MEGTEEVLFAWIGQHDLNATGSEGEDCGPIARVARDRPPDRLVLLTNYPQERSDHYVDWLQTQTEVPVESRSIDLKSPVNFAEIYPAARGVVQEFASAGECKPVFHLSPGTPAMAAVWIILANTVFAGASLLQSSLKKGVEEVHFPFELSAEFLPDLLRRSDERLARLSQGVPAEGAGFGDILYRSSSMARVIAKARQVAPRSFAVLIEGESGTGKELLARAIHAAGPRKNAPFVPFNCAAVPDDLFESQLFGYRKGAFTGAQEDRKGLFEAAQGGTLFLDEVGELAPYNQTKLLRVLQENEVIRVGDTCPIRIDTRIIAATNRKLIDEVLANRFREDL